MLRALVICLLVGCDDGHGTSAYCPNYEEFTSPCGIRSVTSTCGPDAVDCTDDVQGTVCTVGPVSADCTVSLVLPNGTTQSFDVTWGPSTDSICQVDVVTSDPPVIACSATDAGTD